MTVATGDLLRRSRDQVAVDSQALWYLARWGAVRHIAWPDIATVRADDVMQRLIVSDRSGQTVIRLEYQLDDYDKLRDLVLHRVAPAALGMDKRLFHRSIINKAIFTSVLLATGGTSLWAIGQSAWPVAVMLMLSSLLLAFSIARDPNSVEIGQTVVTIHYPVSKRVISFDEIAEIGSEDQVAANGNVWAAVTLVLRQGKPIPLYRFREGSLALAGGLRAALQGNKASAPN